jgi:hypothetical protein
MMGTKSAPGQNQAALRNDANGLLDEALVDDVGCALYLRAESLLMVATGQVKCPHCPTAFACVEPLGKNTGGDAVPCPDCGWTTTREQYHRSWAHAPI